MSRWKRLRRILYGITCSAFTVGAVGLAPAYVTAANGQGQARTKSTVATPPSLPKGFFGGVIEGYYGAPWSQADSEAMIKFLGAHHLNTYVYAPKDDPYQRAKWDQLYPKSNLTELRALIQTANQSGVQFVYSISPGLTATYSSSRDRAALVAKVNQLRALGVHVFMLSFDDIWRGLPAADKAQYHNDMAFAQSSFVNDLLRQERPIDPHFQVLFTPTTYYGTKDNPYWDSLRVHLDRSVPVIWTGSWVLADQIQTSEVQSVRKLIGHPIVIWDNYPVNDFAYSIDKRPKLFMGPVVGRDSSVPSAVAGYLFNPMIQARASWVALWTGADYLTHPQTYNPQTSWDQAIRTLGGTAWQSFRVFAEDSSSYYHHDTAPVRLADDAKAFWSEPPGSDVLSSPFYLDLQQMQAVNQDLAVNLPDKALYSELRPWSKLLSLQGQIGVQAVQALVLYRHQKSIPSATVAQLQQDVQRLQTDTDEIADSVVLEFLQRTISVVTQPQSGG